MLRLESLKVGPEREGLGGILINREQGSETGSILLNIAILLLALYSRKVQATVPPSVKVTIRL